MIGFIFGITFVICGFVAIMVGRNMSAMDRAIAGWPRAPGTITTSHLEDVQTTIRDNRGFSRRITVAAPIVKFTYTFQGRELQGDRVSRFDMAFTKEPLSRYPLGRAVMVYCDPDDPTTAYLEAPQSPAAKVFGVLGYAFVLLGIAVPLVARLLTP